VSGDARKMLNEACWHLLLTIDQQVEIRFAIHSLTLSIREMINCVFLFGIKHRVINLIFKLDLETER
jgi:ethanolamine utilization protein EutP (predicted NTPase)